MPGLNSFAEDTSIPVRQDGKQIWRGKCASDPKLLAEVIRKRAPRAERVVFETGPLSVWLYHALAAEGLPAICTRRMDTLDCDHAMYKQRNVVERMFCRFKDWRRVTTRFDRNIKTFMANIAIAATVI